MTKEKHIETRRSGIEGDTEKISVPSAEFAPTDTPTAKPKPISAPTIPPIKPRNPASAMNTVKMSEFLAPIAFITPISFVLSMTDVNIVFAIPIPPTNKEISAIPITTIFITLRIVFTVPRLCVGV